jgi:hypothetical protein
MRSRLTQKLVALGLLAGVAAVVISASRGEGPAQVSRAVDVAPAAKDPRLVLGRPWLDKLPRSRTDAIELWWFFGSGISIHDRGSAYRSTMDILEFERRKDVVDLVFLQDKKKQTVKFEIVSCSDKPPFDLCLDLKEPLGGKTRLYSWDDDADMDSHVPWAREHRNAAEALARSAR